MILADEPTGNLDTTMSLQIMDLLQFINAQGPTIVLVTHNDDPQPLTSDDALYDSFGQRQISTLFTQLNQYHVILEVDPIFQQAAKDLDNICLKSTAGSIVPLSTFTQVSRACAPLLISHMGQFPATTVSFNLAQAFVGSLGNGAILILSALLTVYIVLGGG